jgi:proline racemase
MRLRGLTAVDSHTEGMPTRVVTGEVGVIPGASRNEKRLHFMEHLDDIRLFLMNEPYGHAAMSGAILQPPTRADADWGVVYIEVSGCPPMCGHGTIGVATVLVETGMVEVVEPVTTIRLDTPAGLVIARVAVSDGHADSVTIENVPSFSVRLDDTVEVPGSGTVPYRLAFGGNFYAMVDLQAAGLEFDRARQQEILKAGLAIVAAINETTRRGIRRSTGSTTATTSNSSHQVRPRGTPDTQWPSTPAGSTARPAAPEPLRGWRSSGHAVNSLSTRTS